MPDPDYKALCAELVKAWDATADFDFNDFGHAAADIVTRARAALAQPEPVALTESDVTELFYRHMGEGSQVGFENAIAEALARWGTPAIEPVPVSERLPGDDECRPNPRTMTGHWCWGFIQHDPYSFAGRWRMMKREWLTDEADFWLPHWALPMPANQEDYES